MFNTVTENVCTGCSVCYLSCNQNAIIFNENELGFLSPAIDPNKCISCDKCKKLCPQNNPVKLNYPKRCYAVWSKDEENWIYSASGGAGAAIAEYAFSKNYCVYGCDYNSECELRHFCAKTQNDVKNFRSSKYSRSQSINAFKEIKQNLANNKKVLYIGTPCQVSALLKLTNNNPNLLTVDLVCHGTPPGKYLKEYVSSICNPPIDKLRFRGEFDQKLTIWHDNKIVHQKDKSEDLYFKAFYDNIISYESCYTCNFAQPNRCSDITIADFWGLGQLNLIKKYSNRPSLLLLNTPKGIDFFEQMKSNIYFEEREVIEGIKGNGRLNKPPSKNEMAIQFQKFYPKYGFEKSLKKIYFKEKLRKEKKELKKKILNLKLIRLFNKVKRKIKRLIKEYSNDS